MTLKIIGYEITDTDSFEIHSTSSRKVAMQEINELITKGANFSVVCLKQIVSDENPDGPDFIIDENGQCWYE